MLKFETIYEATKKEIYANDGIPFRDEEDIIYEDNFAIVLKPATYGALEYYIRQPYWDNIQNREWFDSQVEHDNALYFVINKLNKRPWVVVVNCEGNQAKFTNDAGVSRVFFKYIPKEIFRPVDKNRNRMF